MTYWEQVYLWLCISKDKVTHEKNTNDVNQITSESLLQSKLSKISSKLASVPNKISMSSELKCSAYAPAPLPIELLCKDTGLV